MDAPYCAFKFATYNHGEMMLMEKKKRGVATRNGNARVPAATSTSILTLGFEDLATIVNGNADDDISRQPFDKNFTKEKIVDALSKEFGFVLFTRNCLSKQERENMN